MDIIFIDIQICICTCIYSSGCASCDDCDTFENCVGSKCEVKYCAAYEDRMIRIDTKADVGSSSMGIAKDGYIFVSSVCKFHSICF